jgi:hypothetical protein
LTFRWTDPENPGDAEPVVEASSCLAGSYGFPPPSTASGTTTIQAQGGIGLVAVTSSVSGALLVLSDHRGHEVARGTTDRFGSLIFRELDPGRGYVVRDDASGDTVPVTVLAFKDRPDQSFYAQQTLHEGLNYIQTRDGTLLAAMVRPPLGGSRAASSRRWSSTRATRWRIPTIRSHPR